MDATELGVCAGSFVAHQCLFRVLNRQQEDKDIKHGKDAETAKDSSKDDAKKLYTCYLSHIHCVVSIVSCLGYWATRPVDVLSPKFMVEGPEAKSDEEWMRRTVAFSVGYFANDLLLIIMYPAVAGSDMIVHHVVIGGFFVLGLLDRCCTAYHFLFMIEEMSTPFLNLRWQYRHERSSRIYGVSQLMFAVLFFLSRIVIGTGFVWASGVRMLPPYIASQPSALRQFHLSMQLLACTLSRGLNLYWFWKIVKIVLGGKAQKGLHVDEDKIRISTSVKDR